MATWKKITTEADITAISASLTTTDQAISASVAALSGSASDARDLIAASSGLSGSASTARNVIVSKISGSSTAPIAALSGSANVSRNLLVSQIISNISGSSTSAIAALSSSLTTTNQSISASSAALSGSASTAREALISTLSGSASTARNAIVAKISGSSTAPIAALSGSANVARNLIVNNISGSSTAPIAALSGSANVARNLLVANISGSSTAPIAALSGSSSTARNVLVTNISGSSTAPIAALSGSASAARALLASQIPAAKALSFDSTVQGQFVSTYGGVDETTDITNLGVGGNPTFNDVQVNGNTIMEGDLTVKGTTTSINTTNLLVEDKFAVFASGSIADTDGGIVIQSNVNGTGKGFGYDASTNRWSLQASLAGTATTFNAPDALINTVETSTSAPSGNPVYGGAANGSGTIHVDTATENIYIYS